jgi:hypothetical protein
LVHVGLAAVRETSRDRTASFRHAIWIEISCPSQTGKDFTSIDGEPEVQENRNDDPYLLLLALHGG